MGRLTKFKEIVQLTKYTVTHLSVFNVDPQKVALHNITTHC